MTDKELTELDEITSLTGDEYVYVADETGTTPVPKKISATNLLTGVGYTEGARVHQNANQNINNTTWTPVTFNTEEYDTDTIHDAGDPTKLTCKHAGKYIITGQITWGDDNSSGIRYLSIIVNSTTIAQAAHAAAAYLTMEIMTVYNLSVNDVVTLNVYQDSGNTRLIGYYSLYSPIFTIQRIG
jgi:hypothetical protein